MEEKNTTGMSYMDPKLFILNELAQAKELLRQLETDLHTASSTNGSKLLIPQILSYFENSLSMLNGSKSESGNNQSQMTASETDSTPTDSPRSVNRSSRSDSESDLMEPPSKKRKTVARWTEQVRVCEQTGLEGPLDDGYSWRKYGQKDILGAAYPRGYYRCTHRASHGCLAMKQVQRSDEDSSIFNVTYRVRHTCVQAPHLLPRQSQNKAGLEHQKPTKSSQETIINFQTGCLGETPAKVVLKSPSFSFPSIPVPRSPSFSFPSASIPIPCDEQKENYNNIFNSLTPDNHFVGSPFSSPSNSGSNSVCSNHGVNNLEDGQDLQTSDYDLSEFTSAFDSPDLYLDFDFLDSNFRFDM
ncbi:probable WRKY transcription factor 41 [Papaver somniferum]|uniref:probable WRKY transcription factor 41 n=1 Tax=Papaver somniferum TaxID=3469 RepID=UPI000E6FE8C7|nr:probable WRKY transcription factor 41 [Papaver somniferum]